jgi:hypothetical protein
MGSFSWTEVCTILSRVGVRELLVRKGKQRVCKIKYNQGKIRRNIREEKRGWRKKEEERIKKMKKRRKEKIALRMNLDHVFSLLKLKQAMC